MIEFISTGFSLAILTYLHQSYCSLANYFQTKDANSIHEYQKESLKYIHCLDSNF